MGRCKKSRDIQLKTEILNSSDKRMDVGQEPGSIKTTADVRRNTKKTQPAQSINKKEGKNKKT